MSSSAQLTEYVMLSPEGKIIRIPKYMFDAFEEFITKRNTGKVVVNFSEGGITSADCIATKTLTSKNGFSGH